MDRQLIRYPLLAAGGIDLDNHNVAEELVGQGNHIQHRGGDTQDVVDSKDDVPPKDEQTCEGGDNVSC